MIAELYPCKEDDLTIKLETTSDGLAIWCNDFYCYIRGTSRDEIIIEIGDKEYRITANGVTT